jgi:CheY-like chemotaxis protein
MKKTILVADDEAAICEVLEELFLDEGYGCVTAANGQEALAQMEQRAPDLLICDVMMPRIDGWGVLERMQQEPSLAAVPVVMMSAAQSSFAGHTQDRARFLRKPFNLDDMLQIVQRLIGQP